MFECVTDGSQDLFLLLTLPDDSYTAAKDGQQVSVDSSRMYTHTQTHTHTHTHIQLHIYILLHKGRAILLSPFLIPSPLLVHSSLLPSYLGGEV